MTRTALRGALAIAVATATLIAWLLHRGGPPLAEPVTIAVQQGDRLADVADRLVRQGVLRAPGPFLWWARLTGKDRDVRAGEFQIASPLSPVELLARITQPPDALHTVTIPEGLTVQEVVGLLAAAGLGSRERFQALLADPAFLGEEGLPAEGPEGYLFPDTYFFGAGTSPDRVLRTMTRRFREVFTPAMAGCGSARGLSPHQVVTLASLVEEETARPEERPLVAAVFTNRLKHGMPLQADPTLLYGRVNGDRRITRSDLARATSYNTYTTRGLPPTPIANPGRAALEAACAPADVPYLYFVARGDGSHEFNTDLERHNQAVARLRKHERAQRSPATAAAPAPSGAAPR